MRLFTRLAAMEDLPALLELEQQCFNTDRLNVRSFKWMICRAHGQLWVAERGGQLEGYALLLFRRGTSRARLYSIAIAPHARGNGLARQLLQHMEARAVEHACNWLSLEVRVDNAPAIALYERYGYQRFARVHGYYQDQTDALRLEKPLALH